MLASVQQVTRSRLKAVKASSDACIQLCVFGVCSCLSNMRTATKKLSKKKLQTLCSLKSILRRPFNIADVEYALISLKEQQLTEAFMLTNKSWLCHITRLPGALHGSDIWGSQNHRVTSRRVIHLNQSASKDLTEALLTIEQSVLTLLIKRYFVLKDLMRSYLLNFSFPSEELKFRPKCFHCL